MKFATRKLYCSWIWIYKVNTWVLPSSFCYASDGKVHPQPSFFERSLNMDRREKWFVKKESEKKKRKSNWMFILSYIIPDKIGLLFKRQGFHSFLSVWHSLCSHKRAFKTGGNDKNVFPFGCLSKLHVPCHMLRKGVNSQTNVLHLCRCHLPVNTPPLCTAFVPIPINRENK